MLRVFQCSGGHAIENNRSITELTELSENDSEALGFLQDIKVENLPAEKVTKHEHELRMVDCIVSCFFLTLFRADSSLLSLSPKTLISPIQLYPRRTILLKMLKANLFWTALSGNTVICLKVTFIAALRLTGNLATSSLSTRSRKKLARQREGRHTPKFLLNGFIDVVREPVLLLRW